MPRANNTDPHAHFRCRICVRPFDLGIVPAPPPIERRFKVDRVDQRREGICGECADSDRGLRADARAITRSPPPGATDLRRSAIDWQQQVDQAGHSALEASHAIPAGTQISYSELDTGTPPHALGRAYGANPIPLFTLCHRVRRGLENSAVDVAAASADDGSSGTNTRQRLGEHPLLTRLPSSASG